jgi:1-acyl-sn-glycerol-3-phosphate acyltransferase
MAKRSSFWNAISWCRSLFLLVPLIYTYTVVLGTLSLLSSLFDRQGRVQHQLARVWSWLILKTCCLPVSIEAAAGLDLSKTQVYAANHVSALDIPVLYLYLPNQFRIIAKKLLFRYPFLGWHLRRSGQLPIDHSQTISAVRSLRKAVETLRQGMPLVIFPEGGRSRTGRIQPFMSGAFYLAIKAEVDVVPVAIVGTYEILPMQHYHVRPGPIQLLLGEPISTAGMGLKDIETLSSRVQQAIEEMYYSRSQVPAP